MSVVDTWILSIPAVAMDDLDDPYRLIDEWLQRGGSTWYPTRLRGRLDETDAWGGSRAAQCELIGGAINYFDVDAFKEFLLTLPWLDRGRRNLQLFVKLEHDSRFTVWQLSEASNWRQWVQLVAPRDPPRACDA